MSLISQVFGNEIHDPFLSMTNKCPVLNTPTDWKETPEAHVFTSDLPGLKKEEVKVGVDDGRVLQISGERSEEKDDGPNDKWHRVERCRGKFLRRFRLPENAKTDEVKAYMENGVLKVTIPKQKGRLFKSREINGSLYSRLGDFKILNPKLFAMKEVCKHQIIC